MRGSEDGIAYAHQFSWETILEKFWLMLYLWYFSLRNILKDIHIDGVLTDTLVVLFSFSTQIFYDTE